MSAIPENACQDQRTEFEAEVLRRLEAIEQGLGEPPSILLNVGEVARLLGIGDRTVWALVDKDPTFPRPVPIGRRKLWRRAEIEKWAGELKNSN